MAEEKNIAELAVTTYDVAINDVDAGYVDNPEVTETPIKRPIKLSQLFEQRLGSRVVGVDLSLKLRFRQIKCLNLARAFPWFDGVAGTNPIPLAPAALGEDLYQYAVPIVLHPRHLDAEDTDQDYTLLKCVPVGDHKRSGAGESDDAIEVEFEIYPDRDQLPAVVLGYIGQAPA